MYLVKKYIFGTMIDIFGVFRPVLLDFPTMLPQKILFPQFVGEKTAHWDFLPKFLSLQYYTTLEGVLGVQRRGQGQKTIICLLGPLFFSQNEMTFKKATKIIKIHRKLPVFFGCFQSLFNFGWKTAAQTN